MPTATPEETVWVADVFDKLVTNIEKAVVGRTEVVKIAVTCLFAQGHLLLEDVAGTGKTTLARSLARCVFGSQSRIQFTPDLAPSDITGVVVFDERTERYRLHPGPIFNSIVVVDEINRATPRTQSALLEVMEEARVTVQGITNTIGPPFMVIATQNPQDMAGTFPLPEAQLDRFLMRLHLGYPEPVHTLRLLSEARIRDRSAAVEPVLDPATLARACEISSLIYVDGSVLAYVNDIVTATQRYEGVRIGISVRGALAYVRCCMAWAATQGRNHVLPSDVQELAHHVLEHRMSLHPDAELNGLTPGFVVDEILKAIPEPLG